LSSGARVREVLELVAETAEQVADDQLQVAQEARAMREERRKGSSWAFLLDRPAGPGLLGRLRRSTIVHLTRTLTLRDDGPAGRPAQGSLGTRRRRKHPASRLRWPVRLP